ncbi:acyl-CoA dehydrogenase family protein [Sporichthya brevicatena]|uniref:Acyl-CoA dehydrogenase family protein n=1 Tax=Sporichthya brevicatena TaxID=171442 RepID=A0ABP3SJ26_9ACTN
MRGPAYDFELTELTEQEQELQRTVRAFVAEQAHRWQGTPGLGMGAAADREFSKLLGARGWLGMGLPVAYGGGGRSMVERFVVVEELLRAGAPVAHHWFADRQSGMVIAKYGTEDQKRRFLPGICAGELAFCVGMSEPDSGSDLASVTTRAVPHRSGWLLNGTKVWTSGAQYSDWMIALVRTSAEADRHAGLSQVLVDLRAPGVRVSPIQLLTGESDFCEVSLVDVWIGPDQVLGVVGEGWAQVTSELAYERSGPERWLSTYLVLEAFLRAQSGDPDPEALSVIGEMTARMWALRLLSLSMARALDAGRLPVVESSMVKEMATRFEQELLGRIQELVDVEPDLTSDVDFERLLGRAVLAAPIFTLRGGTIEILRTVVAKGLCRG